MSESIQAGQQGIAFQISDDVAARLTPLVYRSRPNKKSRHERWCLALIYEHQQRGEIPTSARFLYYELVQRGLLDKHEDNDVPERLRDLSIWGLVPWNSIVDETRSVTTWRSASSVIEYIRSSLHHSTMISPWAGYGSPPLIITESRSLRGVLRSLSSDYLCPITSNNGQAHRYIVTQIAPLLEQTDRDVLYLGDLDFSGKHIEDNVLAIVSDHAPDWDGDWRRIAITQEQVDQHNLTVIRKYDGRDRKYHDAVETEALGQGLLTQLLRAELDLRMPESRLQEVRDEEDRQRRALAEYLDGFDPGE
jgi:hypothetical protein